MTERPKASASFRCDLVVRVSVDGTTFEQVRIASREDAVIGNTELLAVPVPEGADFVARVQWLKPWRAMVEDGSGRRFELAQDDELELDVGPYTVTFTMLATRHLRRTSPLVTAGSLSWFVMVMMLTSIPAGFAEGQRFACEVAPRDLGIHFPFCPVDPNDHGAMTGWNAEYLARLLEEDYGGDERGRLQQQERPDHDRDKPKNVVWLPAGAKGPVKEMGGAAEVAPQPVRAPVPEELSAPLVVEEEPEPEPPLYAPEDVGTPIEQPPEPEPEPEEDEPDAVAQLDEELAPDEDADERPPEMPAEEKEGWGLQDWYDERDTELDEMEIELATEMAKERLKINPDDRLALSILSYYQYLGEDFEGAIATYDKYITLYAEDSAGYNNKALVYKRLGEWAKEEGLYHVALAVQPNDVTALNNLAVNYAHQGKFAEAEAVMKSLEVLDPDEPYADLHRAKVFAAQDKVELALEYLERALKGMQKLDTLHHIEFRQDIRVDPAFDSLRENPRFRAILLQYYGSDSPLQETPL